MLQSSAARSLDSEAASLAARLRTRSPEERLQEVQDLFIRRWGEMGATWGINRTMAEIHALLYITGQPLCTDDVMERLNISRGNASMSLRALQDWGIIRRFHRRNSRLPWPRQSAPAISSLKSSIGHVMVSSYRMSITAISSAAPKNYRIAAQTPTFAPSPARMLSSTSLASARPGAATD